MIKINQEALEELVRHAMGSGVAYFTEQAGRGNLDLSQALPDMLGDWPSQFIEIRQDLVEALLVKTGDTDAPS